MIQIKKYIDKTRIPLLRAQCTMVGRTLFVTDLFGALVGFNYSWNSS